MKNSEYLINKKFNLNCDLLLFCQNKYMNFFITENFVVVFICWSGPIYQMQREFEVEIWTNHEEGVIFLSHRRPLSIEL